ncbi:hypothetical protein ACFT7S_07860 [Streptomyces sp. NPDC057136]|uniref:hypothetical protein n=1 Tax=Streptomyces sp. NPDC057136 TaxID=3346029 RepID=UPI003624B825
MTTVSPDPVPTPRPPADEPLLSTHAAVVFVMAAIIGAIPGVLTYFISGNAAGALLAGLIGFGSSALALHKVIGP